MSIPHTQQVWTSQTTGSQRLVLLVLADHANDRGLAWPSQHNIAWRTGLSCRHVRRILADLVERGWISLVRGGGRSVTTFELHLDRLPRKAPVHCRDHNTTTGEPLSTESHSRRRRHPARVADPTQRPRPCPTPSDTQDDADQEHAAGDHAREPRPLPSAPPPVDRGRGDVHAAGTPGCPRCAGLVAAERGHLDVPAAGTPACPGCGDARMSTELQGTPRNLLPRAHARGTGSEPAAVVTDIAEEEASGSAERRTAAAEAQGCADVAADAVGRLIGHLPAAVQPPQAAIGALTRLAAQLVQATGWNADDLVNAVLARPPGELATATNGYAVLSRRLRDTLTAHSARRASTRSADPDAPDGGEARGDDGGGGPDPLDGVTTEQRRALIERARAQLPAWLAAKQLADDHPLVLAEARRLRRDDQPLDDAR